MVALAASSSVRPALAASVGAVLELNVGRESKIVAGPFKPIGRKVVGPGAVAPGGE